MDENKFDTVMGNLMALLFAAGVIVLLLKACL
jgi:hypothetical protein